MPNGSNKRGLIVHPPTQTVFPGRGSRDAVQSERVLLYPFQDTVSLPKPKGTGSILKCQFDAKADVHTSTGVFNPGLRLSRRQSTHKFSELPWLACITNASISGIDVRQPHNTCEQAALLRLRVPASATDLSA
jgi:hypothetical protein